MLLVDCSYKSGYREAGIIKYVLIWACNTITTFQIIKEAPATVESEIMSNYLVTETIFTNIYCLGHTKN